MFNATKVITNPQQLHGLPLAYSSITANHQRLRKLFINLFRIPKPQAGGSSPLAITISKPPDALFGGFYVGLLLNIM
jgi:hypothetical protein